MKRFFAIAIAGLVAVLTLGACACKKSSAPDRLSAEEILQLPKSSGIEGEWFYWPKSFSDVWDRYHDLAPSAAVKGKAISVKYYCGFESYDNCTLIEFQIDEVIDEYNTASLKSGDIITVASCSCIDFQTYGGSKYDAFYEYLSEKTGLDIHDIESYKAAREAYSTKDAASHKFELIPKKGVEYVFAMSSEFAYPLQSGESYTMFVLLTDPRFAFGQECYFSQYIFPLNEELSYEKLNEKYGFRIETFGSINEEIADMFK